jgi:hypothetical protein
MHVFLSMLGILALVLILVAGVISILCDLFDLQPHDVPRFDKSEFGRPADWSEVDKTVAANPSSSQEDSARVPRGESLL